MFADHVKSYDAWYFGSVTVPANGTIPLNITVSSDAHFQCKFITGTFTTLDAAGADGGANGCSMLLRDAGRDLNLFNLRIPLSLFFTPGRVRSSGVAGDPSHQIFYPTEFNYPFLAGADIEMDFASTLATDNVVNICFMGTKFRKTFAPGSMDS